MYDITKVIKWSINAQHNGLLKKFSGSIKRRWDDFSILVFIITFVPHVLGHLNENGSLLHIYLFGYIFQDLYFSSFCAFS